MAALAGEIRLKGPFSPKRVERIFHQIETKQTISRSDLGALEGFARSMHGWHRELHGKVRDSERSNAKVQDELVKVHQFLHQWDGAKERYRVQARSAELSRIAEGSPEVSPTTSAFYAFAQISQGDMKQVLGIMEQIDASSTGTVVSGNQATTLNREAIWQTKMRLLDKAIADGEAGRPTEINVQYYELTSQTMLSRLAAAARAGNKVRVNLDPGRLLPSRDDGTINAGAVAKKMLTAYRLLDLAAKGSDVGMTFFPVEREIGESNLMHQKLFRVGDAVILGGMNANSDSGENVDAAVLVEGPGARRLVEVFKRDTTLSSAARLRDIYNPRHAALVSAGGMLVGPSALTAMLMAAAGPKDRDVDAPRITTDAAALEQLARKSGLKLSQIIDVQDAHGRIDEKKLERFLSAGDTPSNVLPLKREGGRMLSAQVKDVVGRLARPANVRRANDISSPAAEVRGNDLLTLGDSPNERVAILLHAISTAEKFIYVPSFVMTRVVARAIAARYEEMQAQGRTLDVRVVLDPGIYPDGGTPNEAGYTALEDAGIPVRWANLTRTSPTHNRKVHAKAIITDKTAFLGSTNLSTKGLKSNWELSGLVTFDEGDRRSAEQKDALVRDFLETWEHESIRVDTRAVATSMLEGVETSDRDARLEECRHAAIMASIRTINAYSRESAKVVAELVEAHPEVQTDIERRVAAGSTRGYATLSALEGLLGRDAVKQALGRIDAAQKLERLAAGEYPFAS